jgi:hypothetical protein
MADWLRFEPTDDTLFIHILVGRLFEIQPDTMEGTDEFCRELYPVLDKIYDICIEKNLKQVCTSDLTGIDITKIKPIPLIRMIWNVYEYTKDRILLSGVRASGSDPFVKTLVESIKGFLPPFMRGMITIC